MEQTRLSSLSVITVQSDIARKLPLSKLLNLIDLNFQIRVHCQFLGHLIVGDTAYGIGDYDTYRTMLHSYKIVLKIDTKRRQFLKAKAEDPFVNSVDPDYVPLNVVNKLNM